MHDPKKEYWDAVLWLFLSSIVAVSTILLEVKIIVSYIYLNKKCLVFYSIFQCHFNSMVLLIPIIIFISITIPSIWMAFNSFKIIKDWAGAYLQQIKEGDKNEYNK